MALMDVLKKSGSNLNPTTKGNAVAASGLANIAAMGRSILGQALGAVNLMHHYEAVVGLPTTTLTANTDTDISFSFVTSSGLPSRANSVNPASYVADTPRLMPVRFSSDRKQAFINDSDSKDYFRLNASIYIRNNTASDASVTINITNYNSDGSELTKQTRIVAIPAGEYGNVSMIDGGTSVSGQYMKVTARSNVAGVQINNGSRILIFCDNRGTTMHYPFAD